MCRRDSGRRCHLRKGEGMTLRNTITLLHKHVSAQRQSHISAGLGSSAPLAWSLQLELRAVPAYLRIAIWSTSHASRIVSTQPKLLPPWPARCAVTATPTAMRTNNRHGRRRHAYRAYVTTSKEQWLSPPPSRHASRPPPSRAQPSQPLLEIVLDRRGGRTCHQWERWAP